MKATTALSILGVAVALVGCQTLPAIPEVVGNHHDMVRWRRSQIEGLIVVREESGGYERLEFLRGGYMLVTAGSGKMLTSPIAGWRLVQGRLFYTAPDQQDLQDEIFLVSLTDSQLQVRDPSGRLLIYKVQKR